MTPIHPKDRPKVIAMGALCVVMLGFFLMTLMGAISKKGSGPVAGNAPPVQVAGQPAGPAVTASVAPFGKPVQTPAAPVASIAVPPVVADGGIDPFRHVLPDPAELQRMTAQASLPPVRKMPPPISGAIGPSTGGVAVAAVVPPDPIIRLEGVVTDHDRYAMVTFNERTDMYRVGSRIAGIFTVTGISSEGATFHGPKGTFRLAIGEDRSATAPIPKEPASPKTTKAVNRQSEARPQEVAEYATLPLPTAEGPAAGRGH